MNVNGIDYPIETPTYVLNENFRNFAPEGLTTVAVSGDEYTSAIILKTPRYYKNLDLSEYTTRAYYYTHWLDDEQKSSEGSVILLNFEVQENEIVYVWQLDINQTYKKGRVDFGLSWSNGDWKLNTKGCYFTVQRFVSRDRGYVAPDIAEILQNEIDELSKIKQDKQDNNLKTEDKTVVGAINGLNDFENRPEGFATEEQGEKADIAVLQKTGYDLDNLIDVEIGKIYQCTETANANNSTIQYNEEFKATFIEGCFYKYSAINSYYLIDVQDLSDYYTKSETNALLNDKQDTLGVIEENIFLTDKVFSFDNIPRLNSSSAMPENIADLTPKGYVDNTINDHHDNTKANISYVDNADNNLQQQIDALVSSSDVVDVVGTYAELQAYDTTHLKNNDIVKVLQDETKDDAITYYRWVIDQQTHTGSWSYVGQSGPYYTKSEADTLLGQKADASSVYDKRTVDTKLNGKVNQVTSRWLYDNASALQYLDPVKIFQCTDTGYNYTQGYSYIKELNQTTGEPYWKRINTQPHINNLQDGQGQFSLQQTGNTANAPSTFAEGFENEANGNASHVENVNNKANGVGAHAQGGTNEADGDYSTVGGVSNYAYGYGSDIGGSHNVGNGSFQMIRGHYAKVGLEDTTPTQARSKTKVLFALGNGIGVDKRSNAFAVYASGDLETFGTGYIGSDIFIGSHGICIGDSITEGMYVGESGSGQYFNKNKTYPKYLSRLMNTYITNAGITGDTAQGWYDHSKQTIWYNNEYDRGGVHRTDRTVLDYSGYDFAIIQLGINDGLSPAYQQDPNGYIQDVFGPAIDAIITELIEANPNIKIFLQGILPIFYDGAPVAYDRFNHYLENKAIQDSNKQLFYIDVSTNSKVKKNTPYAWYGHPSSLGYEQLANELYSLIGFTINQNLDNFNKMQFNYIGYHGQDYATKQDVSEATANFITNTVNNLTNYYLKSETYDRTEVNNLIGAIQTAHFEVVNVLPPIGESNVIYLILRSDPETSNIYDEYIYINNAYEKIGSTDVDLTGYATESWVNQQIANFLTQTQIENLISTALTSYYTQSQTNILLVEKQDKYDEELQTVSRAVVGAINEVNRIAKGAQQGLSFADYETMIACFNRITTPQEYHVGQSVYIGQVDVPDLWIYANKEVSSVPYDIMSLLSVKYTEAPTFVTNTFYIFNPGLEEYVLLVYKPSDWEENWATYYFVDNDKFIQTMLNNVSVQVGYYRFAILETAKVDLSQYYTKSQTNDLLADKLTEPSSGLAVGKYFRVASIDTDGHAVLECVDLPEQIFVATYGATTYNEIIAARKAGKDIICWYNNILYKYCASVGDALTFNTFRNSNQVYTINVTSSNIWVANTSDLVSNGNYKNYVKWAMTDGQGAAEGMRSIYEGIRYSGTLGAEALDENYLPGYGSSDNISVSDPAFDTYDYFELDFYIDSAANFSARVSKLYFVVRRDNNAVKYDFHDQITADGWNHVKIPIIWETGTDKWVLEGGYVRFYITESASDTGAADRYVLANIYATKDVYTWTDAEKNSCYNKITIRKTILDSVLVPNAMYDLGSTEQASVTLTLPTPSGTDNYSCNGIYVTFKSGSTATTLSIVGTYAGDASYVPNANSICELSFKYVCGTWVLVAKDTALPSA